MEQSSVLQLLQDPLALAVAGGLAVLLVVAGFLAGRRPRRPELPGDPPLPSLAAPPDEPPPSGADATLLARLRSGLSRTSEALGLSRVFSRDTVDEALFTDLEEALLAADVGVATTTALISALRQRAQKDSIREPAALRRQLTALLRAQLEQRPSALAPPPKEGPYAILVVGVNGSGKTTTIGKLAGRLRAQGQKVLLGAGDTFRAGAIEQLKIWSERSGADFVAHQEGADPAAVLFDALEAAKARGCNVVICDTAGRLQSQKPLMDQLSKVTRVMSRAVPGAPHEVLLVLDATIGQNALSQARLFGQATGVTGVVLTKLDGTAKGGIVIAISAELKLPVKFIGIGEKIDDLRPFDPATFAEALLGGGS